MLPPVCECAAADPRAAPSDQSVLNAAKSECSMVESFIDLRRSVCMRPAAEKTRSTPMMTEGLRARRAGAMRCSAYRCEGRGSRRCAVRGR